jgi:hypothetical protein
MAIHHQKSAAKPLSAALTSTNSGGNLTAEGFTNSPQQLDYQFATPNSRVQELLSAFRAARQTVYFVN